jgi:putative resolvase
MVANIHSSGLLSVAKVSRRFNIHPNTIRNWTNEGKLKTYRTLGGHRRISPVDVAQLLGIDAEETKSDRKVILYARVSTNGQSKGIKKGNQDNALARQIKELKAYASKNYRGQETTLFRDTGSGLNYLRRDFRKLIDEVLQGLHDGSVLLVTFKDRLSRFSHDLIQQILQTHNIELVYTSDEPEKTEQQELVEDMLALTHLMSCKVYSRRANSEKQANVPATVVKQMFILYKQGFSYGDVAEILAKKGIRFSNMAGTKQLQPTFMIVKNQLQQNWNSLCQLYKDIPSSSLEDYVTKKVGTTGNESHTIKVSSFYAQYKKWCKMEKRDALSKFKMLQKVRELKIKKTRENNPQFVGIKVSGAK